MSSALSTECKTNDAHSCMGVGRWRAEAHQFVCSSPVAAALGRESHARDPAADAKRAAVATAAVLRSLRRRRPPHPLAASQVPASFTRDPYVHKTP